MIDRLGLIVARYDATQSARLAQNSADTLKKLEKIEARLAAIEKSFKKP
jgi:hypothetical protein